MNPDDIEEEEEEEPRKSKEWYDWQRMGRDVLLNDPIAVWLGVTKREMRISDEEPDEITPQEIYERYVPPDVERYRLKFDNSAERYFGQIEPFEKNLGQRHYHLPLVFETILPCPFSLNRVISISARAKNDENFNNRFRIIITSQSYALKYICDIGFRCIALNLRKEQENELDDIKVPTSTYHEYKFSVIVGPDNFYYVMDNELDQTPFAIPPAPLVYPGDHLEVRGTCEFVSQFHIRTTFPYIWPPQQDRHAMEIAENYFHYTIGLHVKPGHCFIITFRPYEIKGGLGIQLKAGPYRQTPLSIFGYFDSEKAVEIESTNDKFEFVPPQKGRSFPFKFDKLNRVAILVCDDEFKVAVNGQFYVTYGYTQSHLPGDITDIKINTDKGTKISCSSFHNAFIEDYATGEKQLENYSELDTQFMHNFHRKYYGPTAV